MSQSDSSSDNSDSDISEEVAQNVQLAFEAMKQRLSSSASKGKPQNGHLLKKIYETFTNDKVRSAHSGLDSLKKVSQHKRGSGQEELTEFIIDRSSGFGNKTTNEENVETFDLSNIKVTDEEQHNANSGNIRNKKKKRRGRKHKRESKINRDGLSSELSTQISTEDVYINVDPDKNPSGHQPLKRNEQRHKEPEVMKKSVITDDFERQDSIATAHTSHRQKKKERKLEREKTKGNKWYHMPAVELTDEQKTDLKVLQMRKALDPKRFYKANDSSAQPKFVQFGKVIENAADFYDSRIPKKQRKATIVEELLADTEFRKYNKRKYEEIQEARRLGKGPYKHMKRMKKSKT